MSSIFKAIGPLLNIALLLLFAVIIFAIVGLEFYAGALNRTCYSLDDLGKTSGREPILLVHPDPPLTDEMIFEGDGGSPCFPGAPETAPMGAFTCDPTTSICLEKWHGPNFGITSFDNIGLAMLTVFQCVSMEGWTPIMYSVSVGWTGAASKALQNVCVGEDVVALRRRSCSSPTIDIFPPTYTVQLPMPPLRNRL